MSILSIRPLTPVVMFSSVLLAVACGPANNAETAASPVVGATRATETMRAAGAMSYDRRADDGTMVAKVVVPAPLVWTALLDAMTARNVTPTLFDRAAGRMGDTALVMMRRWNGESISRILTCGTTMTGPRADEERIRAVLLAQMTRLKADTVAVAVHFSGVATNVAGAGGSSQCSTTGRVEADLLDDVIRRVGGYGVRVR